MIHDSPHFRQEDFAPPDFTPVPLARTRHDGWTPERQRAFLTALAATGTASAAAKMVGMSRKSAYALRARADAGSFADAWDKAISFGRARMFDSMMERAMNGVTTFTLRMGGAVDIRHGPDGHLMAAYLKSPLPGESRFGGRASGLQR